MQSESVSKRSEINSIGKRVSYFIADLRAVVGMTQVEFAKAMHSSRSYVSAIENGDRSPNIEFLFMLHRRFGVSIDAMFDDIEIDFSI